MDSVRKHCFITILWIFCPFEHCVLRNHAIHLPIINMVTDYTQYEVRSTQCSNGQKIHSILLVNRAFLLILEGELEGHVSSGQGVCACVEAANIAD